MKKHKTKKAWIHEHISDAYVLRAQAEGWRSRAVFKLMEIDDKEHLLAPGMTVVDLGAAPGSWSQLAVRRVRPGGKVYALDMLEMPPIPGVEAIRGDFREAQVLHRLEALLGGESVDLVLSDMAPNLSGIAASDQARVMHLAELALDFAKRHLKPGGNMLVKLFQGAGEMEMRDALRQVFEQLSVHKPAASRGRSAETFILARKKRVFGRQAGFAPGPDRF